MIFMVESSPRKGFIFLKRDILPEGWGEYNGVFLQVGCGEGRTAKTKSIYHRGHRDHRGMQKQVLAKNWFLSLLVFLCVLCALCGEGFVKGF
jgi:hypothetical protein